MPGRDRVSEIVREWMTKADNDLRTATHTLELGHDCPTDTVVFHAQQCVEKCLKALLVFAQIDLPRTHDIEILMFLVPARMRPDLKSTDQAQLTQYAVSARYPGWDAIDFAEARRAAAVARRHHSQVLRSLSRSRPRSKGRK